MIITLSNNKGGVLKTSSVANIAASLALQKNKKVLILDLDPQSNIATTFKTIRDKYKIEYTIMDYLYERETLSKVIDFEINNTIKDNKDLKNNISIMYGSSQLEDYEELVRNSSFPSDRLETMLLHLNQKFDYVIVDTPPALSLLTVTALKVSNKIIIPYEPDIFATDGMIQLLNRILANWDDKEIFVLATKMNKSADKKQNLEAIRNIKLVKDGKVKIINTPITFNNYTSKIIKKYNVPLVLCPNWKKLLEKYVNEFKEVCVEIGAINE